MRPLVPVTLALVLVVGLAGCGADGSAADSARASAASSSTTSTSTTTRPRSETTELDADQGRTDDATDDAATGAGVAAGAAATGGASDPAATPTNDDGRLCAAVAALDAQPDPLDGAPPMEEIDDLIPYADGFDRLAAGLATLVDAAPASLRADARALTAEVSRMADLLRTLHQQVGSADPAAAHTRDLATVVLAQITTDIMGTDTGQMDQVRYANPFLAWIDSPCGPKPLVGDNPRMSFDAVSDSL
jgi:hypothetical protein